jgi:hypothetical protein
MAAGFGVPLIDLCAEDVSHADVMVAAEHGVPLRRRLIEFETPFRAPETAAVAALTESRADQRLELSLSAGMGSTTARVLTLLSIGLLALGASFYRTDGDASPAGVLIPLFLGMMLAMGPLARGKLRNGNYRIVVTAPAIEVRRSFVLAKTVQIPTDDLLALRISALLRYQKNSDPVPWAAFLDLVTAKGLTRIRFPSVAGARRARWLIESFIAPPPLAANGPAESDSGVGA